MNAWIAGNGSICVICKEAILGKLMVVLEVQTREGPMHPECAKKLANKILKMCTTIEMKEHKCKEEDTRG
jgi:hypothetical protein